MRRNGLRWVGHASLVLLGTWLAGAAMPGARADDGSQVVVVYNQNSAASRHVAEYYAKRRRVPAKQVIGLGLPETENITRQEYRTELAGPLLHDLQSRDLIRFHEVELPATSNNPAMSVSVPLSANVRYLVLCYRVPLRIVEDPNLREARADRLPERLRRNEAAVDSELAMLPSRNLPYLRTGPWRNPVYRAPSGSIICPTNGVLMVARLDGPSAKLAEGLVDKAIQAERNGLWGRAYFDARGLTNGEYRLGDEWIEAAYNVARAQGIEALLDLRPATFAPSYPMAQIALYAGWYSAKVNGPFTLPHVEFMPGAIAYHIYSYSASTVRSTSSWVGTFIAKGATATMGCVDEPYLGLTPNVALFFERLLNRGFTFGEAAYACQPVLSWQTTVVGDPLYRPFGRPLNELLADLRARKSPLVPWALLREANLRLVHGQGVNAVMAYLRRQKETAHSAVLRQKLGDLLVLQGKLSSAIPEYLAALADHPSAQERIHLRLGVARMFAYLGKDTESLTNYQAFFRENPHFPDLLAIYRAALPVAEKTQRGDLVRRYERAIERLATDDPSAASSQN